MSAGQKKVLFTGLSELSGKLPMMSAVASGISFMVVSICHNKKP
jgi:hypothetical protein